MEPPPDVFPLRPDPELGPASWCDPDAATLAGSAKCSFQCPLAQPYYRADLRGCVAQQCAATTAEACARDPTHRRGCPDACDEAFRRARGLPDRRPETPMPRVRATRTKWRR